MPIEKLEAPVASKSRAKGVAPKWPPWIILSTFEKYRSASLSTRHSEDKLAIESVI